jgi:hypothetical protein
MSLWLWLLMLVSGRDRKDKARKPHINNGDARQFEFPLGPNTIAQLPKFFIH